MSKNKTGSDGVKVRKNKDNMNPERWLYLKRDLVAEKGTKRLVAGQRTRKRADFGKMKRI